MHCSVDLESHDCHEALGVHKSTFNTVAHTHTLSVSHAGFDSLPHR